MPSRSNATGDRIEFIDAPDWRTKAAKEARSNALLSAAVMPLLEKNRAQVTGMVAGLAPLLPEPRTPEATLLWREANGAWCRARPDALCTRPDRRHQDDDAGRYAGRVGSVGRCGNTCMQTGLYRRGYAQDARNGRDA